MKSFLKYLFITLAILLVSVMLFFSFYKNLVINNLTTKNEVITSIWSELYESSNDRIELLKTMADNSKNDNTTLDSLNILLENNYKNRNLYKDECTLNFVKLEYDVNKIYLKVFFKYSQDSVLKKKKEYKLLEQVNYKDDKINSVIEDYNSAVLDYNRYIATFPNFLFAKRNGFNKKKYFNIKFGEENEDPVVKSKKFPEWAKDKDTL